MTVRIPCSDAFHGIDMEKSFKSLFELLWYTQLPCFDVRGITSENAGERSLLKQCRWKSKEVKCSAIFKMFPTDRGMCCTFNLEAAEKIFHEGQ